jgi:purine nucleosidase
MEQKRKVFVWTDIGTNPDDVLALLMLLRRPEIDIVGISTCVDADGSRARFLRMLTAAEGRDDIPVAQGRNINEFSKLQRLYLGQDLLKVEEFPDGADLFNKTLQEEGRLDVLTLGPLSDMAHALKTEPGLAKKIKEWIAMGGSLDEEDEYNFCYDAEASSFLFTQKFSKKVIPLELSRQFFLKEDDIGRLRLPLGIKNHFWEQCRRWMGYSGRNELYLNDPLAAACLIGIETISFKTAEMKVMQKQNGWKTESQMKSPGNCEIAVGIDRGTFFEMFFDLLG